MRRDLLVLHGAGSCAANHAEFVAAARARGFRAHAVDLPGHGLLANIPLGGDVVGRIRGSWSAPTALRGSSLGAYLALHAAAAFPGEVSAVVALCPTHEKLVLERMESWDVPLDVSFRAWLESVDLGEAAASLAIPVLYVHARDDERIPLALTERLHALTPGSELVALEHGGHTGPSHDAAVHELTLSWLEGVLA